MYRPVPLRVTCVGGENGGRACQDRREEEGTGKKATGIGCEDQDGKGMLIYVSTTVCWLKCKMQLVQKENDLQYLLDLREGRGQDGKREWMVRHDSLEASLHSR